MTEPLLEPIDRYFGAGARMRGERYLEEGRVHLRRLDERAIAAEVRGTRRYDVSLKLDETSRTWQIFCSCDAFAATGPCKHVWATFQAARAAEKEETRGTGASAPVRTRARETRDSPLGELRALASRSDTSRRLSEAAERRLVYGLSFDRASGDPVWVVTIFSQKAKKRGGWSSPKAFLLREHDERFAMSIEDRAILEPLRGATGDGLWRYGSASRFKLSPGLQSILVPRMIATGRLYSTGDGKVLGEPLAWDAGGPWGFGVSLLPKDAAGGFAIEGFLSRDGERMALPAPIGVLESGFVVTPDLIGEVDWRGAWECAAILRRAGRIEVTADRSREALAVVQQLPGAPLVDAGTLVREIAVPPRPRLLLDAPGLLDVAGRVEFDYGRQRVARGDVGELRVDGDGLVRLRRDALAEQAAHGRLSALGARSEASGDPDVWIAPPILPVIVETLTDEGWTVEAEGRRCRTRGHLSLSVHSGIDWFDLQGGAEFGEARATLPELLRALKNGARFVQLSDGSSGLLSATWLAGWRLAGVATEADGALRFRRSQAWLLDLLLAERGGVDVDAAFARVRTALRRFERFEPAQEPPNFRGELRTYQREGLGWLRLLGDLGLGGCLADDMGLGKTVQVLAWLCARAEGARRPSLVVAPSSVVFNWLREAERFTPELSLLDHRGPDRTRDEKVLARHDLVVTTYGTLRRDVQLLSRIPFAHAILDEAQTIKNAGSQAAKAARLLRADHRIALTGTPVENHLDDLWSIFEFLNPGMLGKSQVFRGLTSAASSNAASTRALAQALRPFLLRRTKEQVLADLPPKIEQVVACDLEGAERKRYDELRDHYRASLLARVDGEGLDRSRMHVLEALLRLRQAACHPGLIDRTRTGETSAKLDALLPMLEEVRESGHKALVFSQFTSFLAIVRDRLDAAGVTYEYLDGKTKDREERVRRFQEDEHCSLFLISLKAGGFGLNLAAADYVFLLDPWWNPAVERQAIDRTHRIGQTRTVNAYRLVARGTIEEKVIELQAKKRELAEAILGETEGTLRDLTREDLERLLS